jgi:hypothetical protein
MKILVKKKICVLDDLTRDIVMKTPFRKILEAEQPLLYICHDKFCFVPCHGTLCVSTVPQKPNYIFVLRHHETFNFSAELLLVHICVGHPLHCHSPILKFSLWREDALSSAATSVFR